MSQLKVLLLGSPQIEFNGRPVESDRRKAVALLAYLLVTAVPHTRDTLATLFWPESDQSRALAYLRRAIWELNNILGEGWLAVEREQVAIQPGADVRLDVAVFLDLLAEGTETAVNEATRLYRADFMAGFTLRDCPEFDDWQYHQAESLRQALGAALEKSIDRLVEKEAWDTVVSQAQRWLSLDPLNETAHRQLMNLFAQSGQRPKAIRQYEVCCQILRDELDILPEAETVALYEAIKSGEYLSASDRLVSQPVPGQQSLRLHQLPVPPTPFIGRRAMLDEITALLLKKETRLLTLIGPGGMGKTRLAIQVAEENAANFADGVCFVPLASLESFEQMVPAIAKALNLTFPERETDRTPHQFLFDYLRHKQLLLILDNFEHLLEGEKATLLNEMLTAAPQSKILVTTRVRLQLQGETLYQVLGMDVPEPTTAVTTLTSAQLEDYSSLKLFAASARRIQPGFSLASENTHPAVRICQMVEGMPLAIELAAGWLELLSLAEIEAEVGKNLDFLETDLVDFPERQRSIRALFDATWRLLSPEEREAIQRLSIFKAGFSREAGQAVSGVSLRVLLGLANKSLLGREEDGRFSIHELLRQYAAERLQADSTAWQEANDRHAEYFLAFLESKGAEVIGPGQMEACARIDQERDNIGRAFRWWIMNGDLDSLESSFNVFSLFYLQYPRVTIQVEDAVMLMELLDALPAGNHLFRVKCLIFLSGFASYFLDVDSKTTIEKAADLIETYQLQQELGIWYAFFGQIYAWVGHHQAGLEIVRSAHEQLTDHGETWEVANAALMMGEMLGWQGNYEEARFYIAESLQLDREIRNQFGEYFSLSELAFLQANQGEYDQAQQTMAQYKKLAEATGDRVGLANLLDQLAHLALTSGTYRQAANLYQQARQAFAELGFSQAILDTYSWESMAELRAGDYEKAFSLRQKMWERAQKVGDINSQAWGKWEMGELFRVIGDPAAADQWYEKSYPDFLRLPDSNSGLAFYERGLGDLAYADGRYQDSCRHFQMSLKEAREMNHSWAVAYALSGLGRAEVRLGLYEEARHHFQQALQMSVVGDIGVFALAIEGLAELLAAEGDLYQAVKLATFIKEYGSTWHEFRIKAAVILEEAIPQLPPEEAEQAQAEGRGLTFEEAKELLLA